MDWHRLFGLLLSDFFTDSPYVVDIERDLSLQQQYLDVLILRRGKGRFAGRLPDGLDDLTEHNLVTFKSFHQALDAWALKELLSHYVTYRKLVSPSTDALLPEGRFRLYAVCSRFPLGLAGEVELEPVRPGVYHCRWGTDVIRIVVVNQLPVEAHNAPLHLFSGVAEQVAFAARHYRRRSEDTSSLLSQLIEGYRGEGVTMSYTMEDFRRDYVVLNFKRLTAQERAEALRGLSPEERAAALHGLSPEERAEALRGLSPEERLMGLSPEEIEQVLKKLKAEGPPRPRKRRRRE